MLLGLEGVIGHVDGTLIKIYKPYKDVNHSSWFHGRKKFMVVLPSQIRMVFSFALILESLVHFMMSHV